ncbi:MAG: VanZ family protein, partial [Sulfuritalea sp.]|nr:VanZ family protein [Sulfuritalea sp.]
MTFRPHAWAFLVFVVAFILYGSLFPFDFRAAPEPFATLLSHRDLFANAADAADNFLLFVPLGLALHLCLPRRRDRLIGALLALLALGLGVQALQLYLPSRIAALADVIWNAAGLAAGLLIAGLARRWLGARLAVSP